MRSTESWIVMALLTLFHAVMLVVPRQSLQTLGLQGKGCQLIQK